MGFQSFQDFDVDDVADGLIIRGICTKVQEMSCFECVFLKFV